MKKASVVDKNSLKAHVANLPQPTSSSQPSGNENVFHQPKTSSQTDFKPQINAPINDGPVTTFNSHLARRTRSSKVGSNSTFQTRLEVLPNKYSQPRRSMYIKSADRAIAIDARIERMARKWTARADAPCSYQDLSHPGRAHPVRNLVILTKTN